MTITNSCCCYELRTGSKIIGWFGLGFCENFPTCSEGVFNNCSFLPLIAGVITIISSLQTLSSIPQIIGQINSINSNDEKAENSLFNLTENDLKIFVYSFITKEFVNILMYFTLLLGVYKNNYLMLIPWLIMTGIYSVFMILVLFIASIVMCVKTSLGFGIFLLTVGFIWFFLPVYCWLCIFSLYQRFKIEESQSRGHEAVMHLIPSNLLSEELQTSSV